MQGQSETIFKVIINSFNLRKLFCLKKIFSLLKMFSFIYLCPGLVLPCPLPPTCQYLEGLTESAWEALKNQGLTKEESQTEVYRRIYSGGVDHQIRYFLSFLTLLG